MKTGPHSTPTMLVSKKLFLTLFLVAPVLSGAAEHDKNTTSEIVRAHSSSIGPSQYEVICYESPSYCAEEFKRLCPAGFTVDGYFRNDFDHGQIVARITCSNTTGD